MPQPLVGMVRASVGTGAVIRGVRPGDKFEIDQAQVTVTPAWHGVTIADGYSDGGWRTTGVSRFVGYALTVSGLTIYHSGDTVLDPALVDFVSTLGVHVAILPINGRDFYRERRGSVGNLDAAEALEFASEIGARVLIPMHYDMARGNTAPPGRLVDLAAERGRAVHVLYLARGQPYQLATPQSAWRLPEGVPVAGLEPDYEAFCRGKLADPYPLLRRLQAEVRCTGAQNSERGLSPGTKT